jgi:hypothetical protein
MLGTIISARHGCNGCGSRNNSLGMGCLGCPHSNLGRVRGVKGFGQTDDTGSGIPDTSTSFNPTTGLSSGSLTDELNYLFPFGGTIDSTGNVTAGSTGSNSSSSNTSSSNSNPLASLAASISSLALKMFGPQPSLIPGTSVVYNPATGQMVSSTGTALSATAIMSSLSSYLPLILLVGGGMFVISMMEKK